MERLSGRGGVRTAPAASLRGELKVKIAQLCPTLCNPMDYTRHGILQTRILVAFPFSRGSSQPRDRTRSPTLQVDSLPAEAQRKLRGEGAYYTQS